MIRPIETRYDGHRFRSRLEARWAVLFDHLGVAWDYEPQGYCLPSGATYLPDFLLSGVRHAGPGIGVWFEVKPDSGASWPPDPRHEEFVVSSQQTLIIARGIGWGWGGGSSDMEQLDPLGFDTCREFCVCPGCAAIGIAFSGYFSRLGCCEVSRECSGDEWNEIGSRQVAAAYAAARSARFEHGESGAP